MNGISRLQTVTETRPPAADAGAGAVIYDLGLKKPLFSDGQNWRDADGNVV